MPRITWTDHTMDPLAANKMSARRTTSRNKGVATSTWPCPCLSSSSSSSSASHLIWKVFDPSFNNSIQLCLYQLDLTQILTRPLIIVKRFGWGRTLGHLRLISLPFLWVAFQNYSFCFPFNPVTVRRMLLQIMMMKCRVARAHLISLYIYKHKYIFICDQIISEEYDILVVIVDALF